MEWYSSEEDYATVDAEGNVTAVAAGETTITVCSAADEEVLATCVVTVVEAGQLVAVESIALNKTETTLHAGGNETLTATVTPANATGSVAYTSSDDEVATVDATTGKITALKPGTATITASQGGKTATCEVTVVADYCLVGQSKSAAFEEKAWVAGYAGVSKVPTGILFTQDEEDATKYSIEVDLYEGDEFKIITAGLPGGWNAVDVLGASEEAEGVKLVDTATTETSISCLKSSASKNIGVANDGKYLITFTLPAEGDPTLTYKYLGPAAALVETEKDIYIKGNITSLNQTDWKHNFDATYKLAYDSEKKEYSIELVVTDEDAAKEFGFAQYGHTDDHSGDDVTGGAWIGRDNLGTDGDANDKFGDSGNYKGATPGTYKIVIKNVDGSWVVNFYAVTAQA
ncbi:MAG: Ig-like domain-containing protein [Clostridiales bacterium]|nr:Ig-like domain-containing protein [Clostridiales bacterium]